MHFVHEKAQSMSRKKAEKWTNCSSCRCLVHCHGFSSRNCVTQYPFMSISIRCLELIWYIAFRTKTDWINQKLQNMLLLKKLIQHKWRCLPTCLWNLLLYSWASRRSFNFFTVLKKATYWQTRRHWLTKRLIWFVASAVGLWLALVSGQKIISRPSVPLKRVPVQFQYGTTKLPYCSAL